MASTDSVPVSVSEAKEYLYNWITKPNEEKEKFRVIKAIFNKHPDLINCEYKHQTGFYGTPLILTLQQYSNDNDDDDEDNDDDNDAEHDISDGKLLNS